MFFVLCTMTLYMGTLYCPSPYSVRMPIKLSWIFGTLSSLFWMIWFSNLAILLVLRISALALHQNIHCSIAMIIKVCSQLLATKKSPPGAYLQEKKSFLVSHKFHFLILLKCTRAGWNKTENQVNTCLESTTTTKQQLEEISACNPKNLLSSCLQ